MAEDILNPLYWSERLKAAQKTSLHHAIFKCSDAQWLRIGQRHKEILASTIRETENVLDCGCAWGRLLTMLPSSWKGWYVGVDISPDFIAMARGMWRHYPHHNRALFYQADLLRLHEAIDVTNVQLDWAVLISIRPMVRRNLSEDVWQRMEAQVRVAAKRLLFLEYDPDSEGSIE